MEGKKFCGKCGKPIGSCTCDTGSSKRTTTRAPSTRGWRKKFNEFTLCNDEVVVKSYSVGKIKLFGTGGATLTVTNRRLVLRMSSRIMLNRFESIQETQIDGVTSVISSVNQGFKMSFIAFGIAALIASYFFFKGASLFNPQSLIFAIGLGVIGIIALSLSRKPSYQLNILAGNNSSTIATSGNQKGIRKRVPGEGIVFTYYPTEEAYVMMNELGALVYDIKTKGDYAIDVWKTI